MPKAGLPVRFHAPSRHGARGAARAAPLVFASFLALAACSSLPAPEAQRASAAQPSQAPVAVGNFAAGLRCMDTLLLDYGARDLTVLVEDLADTTRRPGSGARDMLIAAFSDMTQRSRAIRLVASGKQWGNTTAYLQQAQQRDPFAVVPQYALRGAIALQEGASGSAAALNLDLTLLATQTMSVVPGMSTRNQAVLAGTGAKPELRKFGIRYELAPGGGGDGFDPALRAVVEVGAMELAGRLARVPYWTCLGTTDGNPAVAAEIQDWYDAMAARPAEIIGYFQAQLRLRRVYDGPIDGAVNPQLKEAVARYREALGLAREPKVSLDFFKAYLRADHVQLAARLAPATTAAAEPVPVPPAARPPTPATTLPAASAVAPAASLRPAALAAAGTPAPATISAGPLALRITAAQDAHRFARGSAVQLTILPSRDAHVYCFLQDENRRIMRFFPNRFQRDSRVLPAEGLQLPGAMRFEIVMNPRGLQETVACFATERDVLASLPTTVNLGDFETLPLASLEQVRSAFAAVAGGTFAQQSFQLQAR